MTQTAFKPLPLPSCADLARLRKAAALSPQALNEDDHWTAPDLRVCGLYDAWDDPAWQDALLPALSIQNPWQPQEPPRAYDDPADGHHRKARQLRGLILSHLAAVIVPAGVPAWQDVSLKDLLTRARDWQDENGEVTSTPGKLRFGLDMKLDWTAREKQIHPVGQARILSPDLITWHSELLSDWQEHALQHRFLSAAARFHAARSGALPALPAGKFFARVYGPGAGRAGNWEHTETWQGFAPVNWPVDASTCWDLYDLDFLIVEAGGQARPDENSGPDVAGATHESLTAVLGARSQQERAPGRVAWNAARTLQYADQQRRQAFS